MSSSVKSVRWGEGKITRLEIYPDLPSTNSYGRERIRAGCPSGTVIWALRQSAGRGRGGRQWFSDGSSLTFSVLLKFLAGQKTALLPLTVGLGLIEAFGGLTNQIKVKWPNDLWVGKRKLGGILAESFRRGNKWWVVLGVGLNVNISPRSEDSWISLEEVTSCFWSRLGILNLALRGVEQGLSLAEDENLDLEDRFRRFGNFLNRPIILSQGPHSRLAVARGVLPDGRLLIEAGAGWEAVLPEEISLRFSG